jgi:hypothetical protein
MAAWVASHAPECTELTVEGDRGFESGSLHRRVRSEPRSRRNLSGSAVGIAEVVERGLSFCRGTEGSNLSPSSGESANHRSLSGGLANRR